MESRMSRRLQKEYESIKKNYADQFEVSLVNDNLRCWHLKIEGPEGSIYAKEKYTLQFKFPTDYPIEAPEVLFIGGSPDHEHIYSNGFICMSTLYDDWSAAITVTSVCLSVTSMMASAKHKQRPSNDEEFCIRSKGKGPKQYYWTYDDDKA